MKKVVRLILIIALCVATSVGGWWVMLGWNVSQQSVSPSLDTPHQYLRKHDWRLPPELLHGRILKLEDNRYIIVDPTGDIFDAGRFWANAAGTYIVLRGFAVKLDLTISKTAEGGFAYSGWLGDRFADDRFVAGMLVPKKKVKWPIAENTYDAALLGDGGRLEHWLENERPNIPRSAKYNPKKPPYTPPILVAASYCHIALVDKLLSEQGESRTFDGKGVAALLRESRCEEGL